MADTITFTGKVIKKIFHSTENSWGVAVISSETEIPFSKIRYDYDIDTNETKASYTISIVGKMPTPEIGSIFVISGHHIYSQKYKQDQIEIETVSMFVPKTKEDMDAYLKSILTENQAETLLFVYPNIVQDIVEGKDNVDLSLLKGFGQITYDKAKEKIIENFAISDIITLLIPLGVSFNKLKKLLDDEPNPQILKERLIRNPYVITKIDGISFKVADKIAIQLNPLLKESEERLVSFLDYYFEKVGSEKGHTWFLKEEIKSEIINEVPEVEKFLDSLIEKEIENPFHLYIEDDKIGMKKYHDDEMFILESIRQINSTSPMVITEEAISKGIELAEIEQGFKYNEEQKNAIIKMATNNFSTLRGKAGVGKSSTARGILKVCEQMGYSIHVASFSAKASVRASETTGFKSSTLHRLLGLGKGMKSGSKFVEYDVLFVDECVLNPLYLMKAIFKGINLSKTKIILCADTRQLPPLGIGNVFSDICVREEFVNVELNEIQRQAADSGIIVDANLIREGISPVTLEESRVVRGNKKDLFYIFSSSKEELFRIAVASFMKSVKEKGIGNVVILVPFKKKSLNSTKEFNKVIQEELNSENKNVKFIHGDKEFWLNDSVIHVVNNYDKDIFNGFQGTVSKIETNKLFVDYGDKVVEYDHSDINELELSYSLTTWKYQGSEIKDVIIVMDSTHYVLLSSQYLYCSLTRAKERALILSDKYAFKRCLSEDKSVRQTWLKEIAHE